MCGAAGLIGDHWFALWTSRSTSTVFQTALTISAAMLDEVYQLAADVGGVGFMHSAERKIRYAVNKAAARTGCLAEFFRGRGRFSHPDEETGRMLSGRQRDWPNLHRRSRMLRPHSARVLYRFQSPKGQSYIGYCVWRTACSSPEQAASEAFY